MKKLLIGLLIFGVVSLSIIGIIFGVTNKDNTVVEPTYTYEVLDVGVMDRSYEYHTNEINLYSRNGANSIMDSEPEYFITTNHPIRTLFEKWVTLEHFHWDESVSNTIHFTPMIDYSDQFVFYIHLYETK